jgi:hypothetical protein
MLIMLREAQGARKVQLDDGFHRDLAWFNCYLPSTNGIYMLPLARPKPANIWVDSCPSGAGAMLDLLECYHFQYEQHILNVEHPICHLEALNCVVALRLWAPALANRHVNLMCDSSVAVAVLQAGRGRDPFLLACARHIWLICAQQQIDLQVIHEPGVKLLDTADALSRCHLGASFQRKVQDLVTSRNLTVRDIPARFTTLDCSL